MVAPCFCFLSMVTLMYSRLMKWTFYEPQDNSGLKSPLPEIFVVFWWLCHRTQECQTHCLTRRCHGRLFLTPSLLVLYIPLFLYRVVVISMDSCHNSPAKIGCPQNQRLQKLQHPKFGAFPKLLVCKKKALNAFNYLNDYLASQKQEMSG